MQNRKKANPYDALATLGRKHGASKDRLRRKTADLELFENFEVDKWGAHADTRRQFLTKQIEEEKTHKANIEAEILQGALALAADHLGVINIEREVAPLAKPQPRSVKAGCFDV